MYFNLLLLSEKHCIKSDIYSADLGNDNKSYKKLKGTSMSAPMITGLIANMLWVNNGLTQQEVRNIFLSSHESDDVSICIYIC